MGFGAETQRHLVCSVTFFGSLKLTFSRDISKRPQQITNPTGRLVLAKAGRLDIGEHRATDTYTVS